MRLLLFALLLPALPLLRGDAVEVRPQPQDPGAPDFEEEVFPFLDRLDDYPFASAHRALRTFAAQEGIPFCDLLPTYIEHREEDLVVNAFDAHPNERAHALAAEAILEFLTTRGVVR